MTAPLSFSVVWVCFISSVWNVYCHFRQKTVDLVWLTQDVADPSSYLHVSGIKSIDLMFTDHCSIFVRHCGEISILLSALLCDCESRAKPRRSVPSPSAGGGSVRVLSMKEHCQSAGREAAGNLMHVPPRHSCGRLGLSINPHTPPGTHMP